MKLIYSAICQCLANSLSLLTLRVVHVLFSLVWLKLPNSIWMHTIRQNWTKDLFKSTNRPTNRNALPCALFSRTCRIYYIFPLSNWTKPASFILFSVIHKVCLRQMHPNEMKFLPDFRLWSHFIPIYLIGNTLWTMKVNWEINF